MPQYDEHTDISQRTSKPRSLELLAPARNLECGIAAIDHGADAVYIGASRFGARAAAGNSVEDIQKLCEYAHTFLAKVYVTVNTIIYDNELDATERLIWDLYYAGVDAILVQDMGVLNMKLPSIALHASTQTDNRSAEKVAWLVSQGFSRVVLARELSAEEIGAIHRAVPSVELEAFIHGALCVSYSGLCYASQYCFKRSANRGECAQFCRMEFDLEDADGKVIEHNRHLLSLKDMCRLDSIGNLADSGVTSFKIEGRLKDATYVKNVVAAYNQKLDDVVRRNPEKYRRASIGHCRYGFTADLGKTFNRGFTDYFLYGRKPDIASFDTPKAMGEYVGNVKEMRRASFTVAGTASFANGDGLCFINKERKLEGFRVNRVEGNRIFPFKMSTALKHGMALYRNHDTQFENLLAHNSSVRTITLKMDFGVTSDGFRLTVGVEGHIEVSVEIKSEHTEALKPQRENLVKQLTKLGGTPFECSEVCFVVFKDGGIVVPFKEFNYFIPSSRLSAMRREAVDLLMEKLRSHREKQEQIKIPEDIKPANKYPAAVSYIYNVSNKLARQHYSDIGVDGIKPAFELKQPDVNLLMQCRHCLRYTLGYCVRHGGKRPVWHEPLRLRLADGRRFRLEFDCSKCQMNIYADS